MKTLLYLLRNKWNSTGQKTDFIKVSWPYMYTAGDEGLKSITIFKYPKEKAGEASEAISNTYMIFYGVPGYRYSLNLASGAAATMKMMGM